MAEASSPRTRRIGNEWEYLLLMARENPHLLEVGGRRRDQGVDYFDLVLLGTPAYIARGQTRERHELTIRFPAFYPAVPCEAYLREPVFHANVHPRNGFICLWERTSAGDSVIEAIAQTQRVLSWTLCNTSGEHVMQPEALAFAGEWKPLPYEPVRVPVTVAQERAFRLTRKTGRPRLSEIT